MSAHSMIVELYYGGAWHNVTTPGHVMRSPTITTKRYAGTQTRRIDPGETAVTLRSDDGYYNPANPMSPLYGLAGLSTPMRLTIDGRICWSGEVGEWRPSRSIGGVRRMELTGGGILRRLGIGNSPIVSAITAAALAMQPTVYLPLTDGSLTTIVGTVVPGEPGFGVTNEYTPAAVDGPVGDPSKLPELAAEASNGAPVLTITPATATGDSWTLEWDFRLVRTGDYSTVLLAGAFTADGGGVQLGAVWTDGGAQLFYVSVFNGDAQILLSYTVDVFDSVWHQGRLTVEQSGGTCTATAYLDGVDVDAGAETMTMGPITQITLLGQSTVYVASASMGHITVIDGVPSSTFDAFGGHAGEMAATRYARLCAQYSANCTIIGTPALDSQPMGPQPLLQPIDLLQDCISTDGGLAYESAESMELIFHCYGALCRQTPALVLDVATDIVPPLDPLIGDRILRNDITAERRNGSQRRYELDTGPLSTALPPDGAGRRDSTLTVNPQTDATLQQYAAWLVNASTLGGIQYDTITINTDTDPAPDLSDVEIGTVVQLSGVPAVDDPRTPLLLVIGIEDTCSTHRRTVRLLVTSADPYQVGLATDAGYLDCGASTTAEALDTTETGVDVAIADTCVWTHDDGDYLVEIGGEHMTVTAVSTPTGSAGAWSQTLTVTRSVNGVIKSHDLGAEVHVVDAFLLALA